MAEHLTYEQARAFLTSRHQMSVKLGLGQITQLLGFLGHPENGFRSVHIAGTNGKGSTAAILEAVLRASGYRTGLYTSPHLVDMSERIRIGGRPVSRASLLDLIRYTKPLIEAADGSFFEAMTAMAFRHFADEKVDLAVVETGLGGRLDATNVLFPDLTIITGIGLEHTNILGTRIDQIAREKAGILKNGVPCVTGVSHPVAARVIREEAAGKNAPLRTIREGVRITPVETTQTGSRFNCTLSRNRYDNLFLRLAGSHQRRNCAVALLAAEELMRLGWNIPEPAVREGLAGVEWPGRMDLLREHPALLVDAAHNPDGMRSLTRALGSLYRYRRLILVFGVLQDKNYKKMISMIAPMADEIILTRPENERALDPEIIAGLDMLRGRKIAVEPGIPEAFAMALARARPEDMICCAGSIYLIGEIMRLERQG